LEDNNTNLCDREFASAAEAVYGRVEANWSIQINKLADYAGVQIFPAVTQIESGLPSFLLVMNTIIADPP